METPKSGAEKNAARIWRNNQVLGAGGCGRVFLANKLPLGTADPWDKASLGTRPKIAKP